MKLLSRYANGNYIVFLFDDGTKIRATKDPKNTDFNAAFPENIDVKITNKCSIGCPFCHENSLETGDTADLKDIVCRLIPSLNRGTELAIGGGGLSTLPSNYLLRVLVTCREYGVYPSITVNQMELENNPDFLKEIELFLETGNLYGVGISFVKQSPLLERLSSLYPHNIVIHTINGVTRPEDYIYLASHRFKVLVLGYKDFRRGHAFKETLDKVITRNQKWLNNNLLSYSKDFKSISFDNLAVEQLKLIEKVSEDDWKKYYMGDDGQFTMYIDLVKKKYALNSTTPEAERKDLIYDHNDKNETYLVSDMFLDIKRKEVNAGINN